MNVPLISKTSEDIDKDIDQCVAKEILLQWLCDWAFSWSWSPGQGTPQSSTILLASTSITGVTVDWPETDAGISTGGSEASLNMELGLNTAGCIICEPSQWSFVPSSAVLEVVCNDDQLQKAKHVTYGGSSGILEPGNWSQVCAMTLLIGECSTDLPCQHPGLSPLLRGL
ncbi:unnamed protein product [Boreogadus saida]